MIYDLNVWIRELSGEGLNCHMQWIGSADYAEHSKGHPQILHYTAETEDFEALAAAVLIFAAGRVGLVPCPDGVAAARVSRLDPTGWRRSEDASGLPSLPLMSEGEASRWIVTRWDGVAQFNDLCGQRAFRQRALAAFESVCASTPVERAAFNCRLAGVADAAERERMRREFLARGRDTPDFVPIQNLARKLRDLIGPEAAP